MDRTAEWLEADGLGGFASGTVGGVRTRRYHALLLTATTPPTGRVLLVNGCEAWVETPAGRFALSSQAYAPDVIHPDGTGRIAAFEPEPWPRWRFRLEDGTELVQELFVPHGVPMVTLAWRLGAPRKGVALHVRPFLSGRDHHALHRENPVFRFEPESRDGVLLWRCYPGLPGVLVSTNGRYRHQPDWYRNFLYHEERARGLDCIEDLAAPGVFDWDLSRSQAVWLLAAEPPAGVALPDLVPADACFAALRAAEGARRKRFCSRLARAADAYIVRRGAGKTVVAGYPWFTDWGRDTFIALRGLCLATGRLDDARDILVEWAGSVSDGMLPNRFPDHGEAPEFNSVDAALWYVVAVHDYLEASAAAGRPVPLAERKALHGAIEAIISGYAKGTRYEIRLDADGLLAAGTPGVQLTWMDAKVGDWVVTPRIGKPVEVQALWLNALRIAGGRAAKWRRLHERGLASFRTRFWNRTGGGLYDVVDAGHCPGALDARCRPNQIFAVGGLPFALLEGEPARRVVDLVEQRLWTPMGLRTLAPDEPGYRPRYEGGVRERDEAYHQGTAWPWLLGPFVEAWVRVRGGTRKAKQEARTRFLAPLLAHLDEAGLGHLSEIADGDPPHRPRGCPFQAWSVSEALRLDRVVLAEPRRGRSAC
ncbi:amylo-alpha-1,6-glucosidase [Nitrospira sp. Kam-Ns4a]